LPQYPGGRPRAPEGLSPSARGYWKELAGLLCQSRVLTVGDRQGLLLLCEALALHRAATAVLTKEGTTYSTVNAAGGTMIRPRPEIAIADGAWKNAMRGLTAFGLTPAARGNVTVAPPATGNPSSGRPRTLAELERR
jgi:P27 family predicted phage terminase small subunit